MSTLLNFIINQNEQFQRRLPSLYSDFSIQRETNPDGFSANISAWQDALQNAVRAGLVHSSIHGSAILSLRTGEELLQLLETKNGGRPLALATVIDEAVKQRRMVPLSAFIESSTEISENDRYLRPWWLISWGFRQLGVFHKTSPSGKLQDGQFVILTNVEEVTTKILSKMSNISNYMDQVYTIDKFRAEAANAINLTTGLTAIDLKIILTYLAREKQAIIYDNEVVKFRKPNSIVSNITAEDRIIVSLKDLIVKLNLQVDFITSRMKELLNDAQHAIKVQNRSSALRALRSRKLAEASLEQKIQVLSQVEHIYSKIEQAADQVTMIQTMKASTNILRGLHAQVGGVQSVEDTLKEMQNEMIKVDEISNIIDEAGQSVNAVDDDTLDEELQSLINADQMKEDNSSLQITQERLAEIQICKDQNGARFLGKPVTPQNDREVPMESAEDNNSLVTEGTQAFNQLSLG